MLVVGRCQDFANTKLKQWHNPGNVPPPSKPEDSVFCKTYKTHRMKVNITILSLYQTIKAKLSFIPYRTGT